MNGTFKTFSAEKAVSRIESEMRVVIGHACGTPKLLTKTLSNQYQRFKNLEVVHMGYEGDLEYMAPDMQGHIRHNSLFVGHATRQAIHDGRADYTPSYFFEVPTLFRDGYLPVDVALIQVSAPDAFGFCSYGISNDYTKPATNAAKIVIAQINPHMPYVYGDNFIHLSEIDFIVPMRSELQTLKEVPLNEVTKSIGAYCATLVPDGATLQLGIGGVPNAVLNALSNKKQLSIHSELISDGVMQLMASGAVDLKSDDCGMPHVIATFAMGSSAFYQFLHKNHHIGLYPVDFINHPITIGKRHKMIAINTCIEIDLLGQVNSETVLGRQYSGTGGQVDFIRGARLSEGGRSIIALPSTAKSGKISRIVPQLERGTVVTTPRNDVDFIVTEYGIAQLRGKSIKQRAEALIGIAHPSFRPHLRASLGIL